jgi:hypothetical protein
MSDNDAPPEPHLEQPLHFPDGINQVFERCERYEFEQLIEPGR